MYVNHHIELKNLPKIFKYPLTLSTITLASESENSVSTHKSARGGGRGRNGAVFAKIGEQKESGKHTRE